MVRIGLASDSSGDTPLLARALASLERAGAERIFFLGARGADLDAALPEAVRLGASPAHAGRVARAASRVCPELGGGDPDKTIELVGGALGFLVHHKADLTRDEIASATFLFHGAAADAALVRIGPRYFVTPGQLAAEPLPTGAAPPPGTFALLEVSDDLLLRMAQKAARCGVGGIYGSIGIAEQDAVEAALKEQAVSCLAIAQGLFCLRRLERLG